MRGYRCGEQRVANAAESVALCLRPAHVIAVEEIEKFVDLPFAEAAHIITLIYVTRRWTDQDQVVEKLWRLLRSKHADHRAYRVADEDPMAHVERAAEVHDVIGISAQ